MCIRDRAHGGGGRVHAEIPPTGGRCTSWRTLARNSADCSSITANTTAAFTTRLTSGGTLLTGGRFSLAGSVIGALIIQTLTYAIYSLGVPPEVNLVVKAAVVFAVMLLQSAEFRASLRQLVQRPPVGGASA